MNGAGTGPNSAQGEEIYIFFSPFDKNCRLLFPSANPDP